MAAQNGVKCGSGAYLDLHVHVMPTHSWGRLPVNQRLRRVDARQRPPLGNSQPAHLVPSAAPKVPNVGVVVVLPAPQKRTWIGKWMLRRVEPSECQVEAAGGRGWVRRSNHRHAHLRRSADAPSHERCPPVNDHQLFVVRPVQLTARPMRWVAKHMHVGRVQREQALLERLRVGRKGKRDLLVHLCARPPCMARRVRWGSRVKSITSGAATEASTAIAACAPHLHVYLAALPRLHTDQVLQREPRSNPRTLPIVCPASNAAAAGTAATSAPPPQRAPRARATALRVALRANQRQRAAHPPAWATRTPGHQVSGWGPLGAAHDQSCPAHLQS